MWVAVVSKLMKVGGVDVCASFCVYLTCVQQHPFVPLKDAMQVCEQRGLIPEMVFLLRRTIYHTWCTGQLMWVQSAWGTARML